MTSSIRLLLAEDDAVLADGLSIQLQREGFAVDHAPNGAVAEYLLVKQRFDVAVLDLGLPMVDGITILQRVREAGRTLPVLVLTALDSIDDRVAGLKAGADDYMTKPFDFAELAARLHAHLRRSRTLSSSASLGRLTYDRDTRRVAVGGEAIELSRREWMLLDLFLSQRDRVVSKDQIVKAWATDGFDPTGNNSIEVYIHRLRKKLEQSGVTIRTVRGLGYLLEVEAS